MVGFADLVPFPRVDSQLDLGAHRPQRIEQLVGLGDRDAAVLLSVEDEGGRHLPGGEVNG